MTLLQASAALVLWQSQRFDTLDIARALHVAEADVCRLIDAERQRSRGPDLQLVGRDG